MVKRSVVRLTLAFLLGGIAGDACATGQYTQEIRFFSRSGMDLDNNLAYFHGRLGILRPTFDDNRLFAAYRQMLGGTFTDAQAQVLLTRCCDAPGASEDSTTTWSDARRRVPGSPPAVNNAAPRQRLPEISALDVSCFPNAYRNAAATLLQRIKEHGATDPSVREWTTGEDAVLANCIADSALPADAPNASAWLQADRAYQIATAYFYRFDYARAAELYAAIGQDAASPWRKVARYLAARAAVHAAIVAKTPASIAVANIAIAAIPADPELADYRADAPRLASLLAFGTEPAERAQELAKALLAAELPTSLAVDLHDLKDLERTGKRYTDVGAWIYDIDALNGDKGRQNEEVKADVLARWHDGHALPWLVAAMMFLEPADPDAAEAIAAAQAIDVGSPAYYTLAWNRLRLLIGQGKADEARAEFDRALAAAPLPEGVGNLMRYLRLAVARDIGEFAAFAVRAGSFSCTYTIRAPTSTPSRCRCRPPSGRATWPRS
jgi:Fe-S-cluster formation regulator IscX/YfhJ